jgi:maleamate amidohydrolase
MSDSFENAGYGQGEVGWGTLPAIIAVDFQMSFCDPKFALGRSEHAQRAIRNAARLFPAARAAGIPIIHTAVAWSTDTEFARWKVPALRDIQPGSYEAQIHPDLWDDSDVYILKRFPSAFFGTDMSSILTTNGIDTVLVTGVTSSGCVRATIVDSFSHGFRTIAIDDACGDQDAGPHDANMRDVGRRYADVIQTDEAISKIKALSVKN